VGILHTGRSYAEDLSEDSLLYHYPRTRRPAARDAGEVAALKWAGTYKVPVFAILPSNGGSNLRSLRLSWVEDSDDGGRVLLLSLDDMGRLKGDRRLELPFSFTEQKTPTLDSPPLARPNVATPL